MNKILIDASAFAKLLDQHPEVEIDLMKNAVPQLTARLMKRVEDELPRVDRAVAEAIQRQIAHISSSYSGMSQGAKEVIRLFLANECREEIKAFAREESRKAAQEIAERVLTAERQKFEGELEHRVRAAQGDVDKYAKAAAEREVLALIRGLGKSGEAA
jgi:CRP-like cAMP-binding protein